MPGNGIRYSEIARVAIVQLVGGLGVGFYLLDRRAYPDASAIYIIAGPIVSATLLSVVLLLCFPVLLPGGRVQFPVNLTLPVLFTLLVRAAVILWTSSQSAVFRPADPLLPALIWKMPKPLMLLAGIEIVLLTLWVMATAKRRP